MIKEKNKQKIIYAVAGFVFMTAAIGSYFVANFFMSNNNSGNDPDDSKPYDELEHLTADELFPKIRINDYYRYIIYEGGKFAISDQMIAILIKDIISRLSRPDGDLTFQVIDISNQKRKINFQWRKNSKVLYKSYSISLAI